MPPPRPSGFATRFLRGVWTLPTNALGHVAGVLVSGSLGAKVGSDRARGRLFVIRVPGFRWVGGVTLGHAILLSPRLSDGLLGRLVLAHELAHTRQHDVLGPFYLPLHVLAQIASALFWIVSPVPGSDPVHAHNPLEQRWLFLGHAAIDELLAGERMTRDELERFLDAIVPA
jgi:hypothetical protein